MSSAGCSDLATSVAKGAASWSSFRRRFADWRARARAAQRHELRENLLIALSATLCGAETCVDMAVFGRAKERFLPGFLRLAGGVSRHDIFRACSGCSIRRFSATREADGR